MQDGNIFAMIVLTSQMLQNSHNLYINVKEGQLK